MALPSEHIPAPGLQAPARLLQLSGISAGTMKQATCNDRPGIGWFSLRSQRGCGFYDSVFRHKAAGRYAYSRQEIQPYMSIRPVRSKR
jgi:hypothetical protein